MEFFDLVNISEKFLEVVNPTTPEKVLHAGEALGLKKGHRVIDFGCGYGETLALWAENFGISGIGIDLREHACDRAKHKMAQRGLEDQIDIVCANAATHPVDANAFDVATCIGATFIWNDFQTSIANLKQSIKEDGQLVIGEQYWLNENVPDEYRDKDPSIHHEHELLQIARTEGFDFKYILRSTQEDWDHYECNNWLGLIHWLKNNPDHPEHESVRKHFLDIQDDYLNFGKHNRGWAIYILSSMQY